MGGRVQRCLRSIEENKKDKGKIEARRLLLLIPPGAKGGEGITLNVSQERGAYDYVYTIHRKAWNSILER